MPNHVSTELTVTGPKGTVNKFILAIMGTKGEFDFNNIVPMPEALRGSQSPTQVVTEAEYKVAKAKFDALPEGDAFRGCGIPITQKMADEFLAKYGATNWYDWANANWSTKWGAYDADDEFCVSIDTNKGRKSRASINFQTAWGPATNFWLKVSALYPSLTFTTDYDVEGNGSGSESFKAGVCIDESYKD